MPDSQSEQKLRATCPACRKAFLAKPALAGREVDCPGCGQKMTVPRLDRPAAVRAETPKRRQPLLALLLVAAVAGGIGFGSGAWLNNSVPPSTTEELVTLAELNAVKADRDRLSKALLEAGAIGERANQTIEETTAKLESFAAAKPDRLAELLDVVRQDQAVRPVPPAILEIEAELLGIRRGGPAHFAHLDGALTVGLSRKDVEESLRKQKLEISGREDFSNGAVGEGHALDLEHGTQVALYGVWNNVYGALIQSGPLSQKAIAEWAIASSVVATLATGELGLEDSPNVLYMIERAEKLGSGEKVNAEVRDYGRPVEIGISLDRQAGIVSCRVFAVDRPMRKTR